MGGETQKEGRDFVVSFFFEYAFQVCTQTQIATQHVTRPFWAAPQVRRKFGAQRRIAQGRLRRPRAF